MDWPCKCFARYPAERSEVERLVQSTRELPPQMEPKVLHPAASFIAAFESIFPCSGKDIELGCILELASCGLIPLQILRTHGFVIAFRARAERAARGSACTGIAGTSPTASVCICTTPGDGTCVLL